MPKQQRIKTKYPGVYFIEVDGKSGSDRIYYIRYRFRGKVIEEKAGHQLSDGITEARANAIRADRIRGKALSNEHRREAEKAAKLAEAGKWTLTKLWDEYKAQKHSDLLSVKYEGYRFNKYLKPKYGDREPSELHQLDIDRLRVNLLKEKSPQTVKHILGLLKRLCNFGVIKRLCPGIGFKIDMPRVDNQTTEDLSPDQLKSLLKAIDESTDIQAATFMKMALFTGMRRGELMKLQWNDIDEDRGFIMIRNPKGGKTQKIPLNDQTREILKDHPRKKNHVFVRENGLPFTNIINKRVRAIKETAGLPDDFRPLHGLRHVYASMLASSGQVDMYTLQKLLTHKSPLMTQRYAHLRDESLRKASNLAGSLIKETINKENKDVINSHE